MNVSKFKNIILDYTRQITDSMSNAFGPLCEQHGLTMMQVRILMELHHYGSHTVGSLANSIRVAGANISAMCKKLENKKLLERVRDKDDERVVKLALTKMGEEIVLEIDRALNEKFSKQIANESEETFDDIVLGLQKLNMILQRISEPDNK